MYLMTFDPSIVALFGVSHLGNRAKSVQECLLILISLVAPYAPKVPTLRKKNISENTCLSVFIWVCKILVLIALLSSDGSGEPVQMRRLTRALAAPIHKIWM